ncbi:glycosyltransferase family 4 protein [Shimia litoralis]|uniref:Glycosyltransferase family 4 protein n=1 Tax=Shimia litoralis TaxID=420403 RepID=A0A4U7MWP4_9RHOB|nr:glycosyltransferase [Shimia litoralis]TKZ17448.1 glycosyltransferase family 4 protein [Shimia litoralis]
MRNIVILAGGYGLDTRNASAVRALGLAQMIQSLGYQVIVMGKFKSPPAAARSPDGLEIDGVMCRDIQRPIVDRSCVSYVVSADPLVQVVDEQGADRVLAVLCYNYPARGAWSMIRQARRRGIAPILDCTEWYGWEGRKILRNLWRLAGVTIRMRVLTRLAGNVSCASRWFQAHVARQHTVLWPFVLDTTRPEWQRSPAPDPARRAHLVYSGSPGMGMHKDRLPVMIASLARLAAEGHDFRISVAGITEAQYLQTMPGHRDQLDRLGGRLQFLGRIPHADSLTLLRSADFSVFFRQPNRVSNTGFATKYVEAATLGVPVISNPTSDIPLYLRDGENGIMARSIVDADVDDALRRAICLTPEERAAMVAACRAENPFDMRALQREAREFLENLRGLR